MTLECGHESDCWCGRCHLCDDVTQDEGADGTEDDE